jgi:hypothetical protein
MAALFPASSLIELRCACWPSTLVPLDVEALEILITSIAAV